MSQDCLSCLEEAIDVVDFAKSELLKGGSAKHVTSGMAMNKSSALKHPGDIFTVSPFVSLAFPFLSETMNRAR